MWTSIAARVGPVVLMALGSMGAQLLTEKFIKAMVVRALEVLVSKTKTERDNVILKDIKDAWGIE
jgi:hypothetical protein